MAFDCKKTKREKVKIEFTPYDVDFARFDKYLELTENEEAVCIYWLLDLKKISDAEADARFRALSNKIDREIKMGEALKSASRIPKPPVTKLIVKKHCLPVEVIQQTKNDNYLLIEHFTIVDLCPQWVNMSKFKEQVVYAPLIAVAETIDLTSESISYTGCLGDPLIAVPPSQDGNWIPRANTLMEKVKEALPPDIMCISNMLLPIGEGLTKCDGPTEGNVEKEKDPDLVAINYDRSKVKIRKFLRRVRLVNRMFEHYQHVKDKLKFFAKSFGAKGITVPPDIRKLSHVLWRVITANVLTFKSKLS